MARLPLHFVRCPACGHVWNRAFFPDAIPYSEQPNRMFNSGMRWQRHIARLVEATLAQLPPEPTVIEIGCGCGHFLHALAQRWPGRYIGFDPNGSASGDFTFHCRLFDPWQDVPVFAPHLVIMRHVLEHFQEPAMFLHRMAWAAHSVPHAVRMLIEVPCIDRVLTTGRLADLFYEHPQQFTTSSFSQLLGACGEVEELQRAYDGEVLVGLVRLQVPEVLRDRAQASACFAAQSQAARTTIAQQLDDLVRSGARVAIWGGTGKAAAFMHHFDVDAQRFALVVDSDIQKVGTYVPGTGQRIQFRDVLKTMTVDVLIIPTQWRAWDILAEMEREGIVASRILIEHEGRLIDFLRDPHPYRPSTETSVPCRPEVCPS